MRSGSTSSRPRSLILAPGGRHAVATGIAIAIPHGYEVQVRSRSGTAVRNGITCLTGTIDSDYRGELKVVLVNLGGEPFDDRPRRAHRPARPGAGAARALRGSRRSRRDRPRHRRLRLDRAVSLSDAQLDRYARHIVLKEIGGEGQRRLLDASVAIVGAGGIGAPAIQYLAAAGIGTIRVIDDDRVTLDNLQRQILFGTGDVGRIKTDVAGEAVERLNPDIAFDGIAERLTRTNVGALLAGADLVLDGSDNFATRLVVSDHCIAARIPLVSAAIGRFQAQIGTFRGWEGALLPLLRRRRLRRRGLRHLLGAGRARRDGGDRRRLRGARGDPADRRLRRGLGGQAPHFRRPQAGDADDPDRQGPGLHGLRDRGCP